MLGKLKKKAPRDNTANPGRGIVAGSNAIHKVAAAGLGLALLVLVASFAFLLLVREPSVRAAQTQVLAAGYAEQQATNIGAYISRLRQRLQSTAHAPAALAVIDGSAADDNAVEAELKAYFPDLASLHIVPLGDMGTAEFAPGTHGLRNNIELDLVRRASEGETTLPESFRFEDRWMTSVAELVKGAGEQHKGAVLVATVDNAALATLLQALKPGTGSYALEQLYTNRDGSTHTTEIARTGSGNASDLQSYAVIPDTNWRIAFTPSASLVDSLHVSSRPLWVVFAMCLVALLGGFAIVMVRIPKIIEEDSFRILAAADRKSDLTLAIPQLVDLARQLRRATLRALRQAAEDSAPPPKMEVDTLDLMDDEPIGDLEEVLELDTEFEEEALQEVDVPSGFPAHIFRAYDIRGNATSELTPELMGRIGQAVGSIAGERGQQIMLVACDGRNSSPALKSALIRSLMDTGRDIIDIGLVPTPVMYFATRHLKARSGLMITGSHNPKTDNGLKIVLDQQTIHAGGIEGIRNRVLSGDFSQGKGRLITEDVAQSYIDHIQQDIAIAVPLKIVIDAGNGATGSVAPVLFEELGCEVVPMFCNIDGNFPNHAPDTSEEANLAALVERVKDEEADFGVAFDGDGDRLAVVTPSGRIVRSDVLLMIFAQDVVSRNPGADVVFDVKCSRNLTELITHCGGRPVLSRTGHAFMKQKMAETGALLGGEFSGHMFFGERWYGFDDGMYAAARLAEILSTQGDSLDAIIDSFPTSVNTPEIKIPVPEASKLQLMERIVRSADFANGKVNTLDGIRVDFAEGWGLLRASNTNPVLTARFEAESEQALETIKNEFRQQIALVDPSLDVNF